MEALFFGNRPESNLQAHSLRRELRWGEIRVKKALGDDIQGGIRSASNRNGRSSNENLLAVYERVGVVIEAGPGVLSPDTGIWALKFDPSGGYEYAASGSEFIIDEAARWTAIPADLLDVVSLVDPLAIASKAFSDIAPMDQRLPAAWGNGAGCEQRGASALVLGGGIRPLTIAMSLVDGGFETCVEAGENGFDREIAERIGARPISLKDRPALRDIAFNLIYDASGETMKAMRTMEALAREGVMIFGGPNNWLETPDADIGRVMRNALIKGQIVLGSIKPTVRSYEDAVQDLGRFSGRWPEAVRALAAPRPGSIVDSDDARDESYCKAG